MVEKSRNEAATAKAQATRDVAKLAKEQQKEAEEEREGQKSPSPEPETNTEQGGADPHISSTQLKCLCPREQVGLQKKLKASKNSFDLITGTLTEGDLHDIGKMVRDVTAEALQ